MIVERIWTGNAYRNYNYLIACPESGEALAIDPLDHEKCLAAAKVKGWQITQILNTHEHHDHTGGNAAVVAATGAKVIAHHRAGVAHRRRRPRRQGRRRDQGRQDASSSSAWTRRATRCATSACARTPTSRRCSPATRCSTPAPATATTAAIRRTLYATFVEQLAKLPDDTRVYPGHDYIENNLRFTLAREPDNAAAKALLPEVAGQDPAKARVTTLRRGEADQHLPAPDEPERDRGAARGLSRSARAARSEDGVRQAARAAQQLVGGAPARRPGASIVRRARRSGRRRTRPGSCRRARRRRSATTSASPV